MNARSIVIADWVLALAAITTLGCVHAREVEAPEAEPSAALEQDASTQAPDAIFRPGAIDLIQGALKKEGYSVLVNGKLDDATASALLAFQKKKNLARTGLPDQETLKQLGLEPQALYASRDQSK